MTTSRINTATSEISLTANGIVRVDVFAGKSQSLQNAKENMAAALEVSAGKQRPLLVNITEALPIEPNARRYYSGDVVEKNFLALALFAAASPIGRFTANVYLRIAKLGIPAKLFTDESDALKWLSEFIHE